MLGKISVHLRKGKKFYYTCLFSFWSFMSDLCVHIFA